MSNDRLSQFMIPDGWYVYLEKKEPFWWWKRSFEGDWRIELAGGEPITGWHAHPRDALVEAKLLPGEPSQST